jgi:hypothetical protein
MAGYGRIWPAWHWRKAHLERSSFRASWNSSGFDLFCVFFCVSELQTLSSGVYWTPFTTLEAVQSLDVTGPSKYTQQSCGQRLAKLKYRAEMFKECNAKCSTPALASQSKRQDIRSAFGVFDVFEVCV